MSVGSDDQDAFEDAVDTAIAMIDARKWAPELAIISVVRRLQRQDELGWAVASNQCIADHTGLSRTPVSNRLKEKTGALWKTQWVLERADIADGSRPYGWRLRHPCHWRGVPWRIKNKMVRDLLLGFDSHDPDEATDEPLSRAEGGARRTPVVARRRGRATNDADSLLVARPKRRATKSRSSAGSTQAGARQPEPFDDAPPSPSVGDESPPSRQEEQEEWDAAQQLIQAIETKAGGMMFSAAEKAKTRRLLQRKGLDEWLLIVPLAPADYKIPRVVMWLERIARGDEHLIPRGAAAGVEVDPIHAQLADVEGRIRPYLLSGEPVPESLMDERDRCQNVLRARGEM